MSYCLHPDCQKPTCNSTETMFCQDCRSKLLLKERYRAIKLIGKGGFGRTFLAVDEDKPSKLLATLREHLSSVCTVAISPDGQTLASGSFDNKIKFWNLESADNIGQKFNMALHN